MSVQERLAAERETLGSELLKRYPVAEYLNEFVDGVGHGGYGNVPPKARATCEAIERDFGQAALERYHRLVLLTLVDEFDHRRATAPHPPEVQTCVASHLRGVVAQMDRNPVGFYLHANDRFAKDFAVCRHKLVPCGAQLVDIRSGVARSLAGRQNGLELFRFLAYMLGNVGGFRVLYEMHMDPRLVLDFNPRGWERCYVRIARLMERNPDVRGVFGCSWWFDPALRGVSPRLDFLRDIPQSGGARLFRAGASEASVGNALANSRERREAYESGTYVPTDWCAVWSRKDLLTWASGRTC